VSWDAKTISNLSLWRKEKAEKGSARKFIGFYVQILIKP
jgi:hypothetical protein